MANETIEVERISDLSEGQYSDDSWLVIDTGTVVVKLKLKDAVPDASTVVKGKVQLSDSTNNDSSHVAATSKAVKSVMDALTQASEALSEAISGKYSKPSSGIPKSDLSSAVQTSLENGDNAVAALAEIGKPLVWHGDADVATLNGTIAGLQNGWTYTLTDSGTLTAGSVSVEVGDEVAWTGSAWFKLGGDGGTVEIALFDIMWDSDENDYIFPSAQDVIQAVSDYIEVQLVFHSPAGVNFVYALTRKSTLHYEWTREDCQSKFNLDGTGSPTVWTWTSGDTVLKQNVDSLDTDIGKIGGSIAPSYSSLTFPIAEGTLCMYARRLYTCSASGGIPASEDWTAGHWTQTKVSEIIGNVETLLAAL